MEVTNYYLFFDEIVTAVRKACKSHGIDGKSGWQIVTGKTPGTDAIYLLRGTREFKISEKKDNIVFEREDGKEIAQVGNNLSYSYGKNPGATEANRISAEEEQAANIAKALEIVKTDSVKNPRFQFSATCPFE